MTHSFEEGKSANLDNVNHEPTRNEEKFLHFSDVFTLEKSKVAEVEVAFRVLMTAHQVKQQGRLNSLNGSSIHYYLLYCKHAFTTGTTTTLIQICEEESSITDTLSVSSKKEEAFGVSLARMISGSWKLRGEGLTGFRLKINSDGRDELMGAILGSPSWRTHWQNSLFSDTPYMVRMVRPFLA